MVGCQGRVAHHYWAMMTNITAPLWTRPGQVVVTLLCFQSWVGETEKQVRFLPPPCRELLAGLVATGSASRVWAIRL